MSIHPDRRRRSQAGASLIEYMALLLLIAIVAIIGIAALKERNQPKSPDATPRSTVVVPYSPRST